MPGKEGRKEQAMTTITTTAADLMTVEEVADTLRINPATVLRKIREGRFPSIHVLKQYLIRRSDFEARLADNTRNGRP